MSLTPRVARLRQESLDAVPTLSTERAELLTRFMQAQTSTESAPVRRARAFAHLLEHKTICINAGELIVGERGPAPKAAPTYPEICCHSLDDLDILNSREKIAFAVRPEARCVYEDEIIPFWQGRTIRELIFSQMTDEWKAAYSAGIYTEFMEQRAPGHTVLDDKIYRRRLLARSRPRAAHVPRSPAVLLVRSSRSDHRAEHVGFFQSWPSGPASVPVLPRRP
jgi:pyruvate-formate lyase